MTNQYMFINFKIATITKLQKEGLVIEYFKYMSTQPINIDYDDLVMQLNEALNNRSIKTTFLNFATIDALEKPLSQILNDIINVLLTTEFTTYTVNYILSKPINLFTIEKSDKLYVITKNVKLPDANYDLMYNQEVIANFIKKQILNFSHYDKLFNTTLQNNNVIYTNTASTTIFSSSTNLLSNTNKLFSLSNTKPEATTNNTIDINQLADKIIEKLMPKLNEILAEINNLEKLISDLLKADADIDLEITEDEIQELKDL